MSNVPLSDTQKRALAIVTISPTPAVALGQIRTNINLQTAVRQLAKLGLLQSATSPALTKTGEVAVQEEGIAEGGQLTEYGQSLISNKVTESVNSRLELFRRLKT